MAPQWISQDQVSSATNNGRARTAYLAPARAAAADVARRYLASNPSAEDVTLEVLSELGLNRLNALRGQRRINRVKQDVGLLVAQLLVDEYGPARVLTLRSPPGNAPAGKRNNRSSLPWVAKYAPHRVLTTPVGERILLDTCCVRNVLHGDDEGEEVLALETLRSSHPISLADHAVPELAAALLRGSIPFKLWSSRVPLVDKLLDPVFPISPGGRERAAMCGIEEDVRIGSDESSSFHRAGWNLLLRARSVEQLLRGHEYAGPSGQRFRMRLRLDKLDAVLEREAERWEHFIARVRHAYATAGEITEEGVADLICAGLSLDYSSDQIKKLDLPIRVLAKRTIQASTMRKTPYRAKGSNDPMDLDLLFGVGLPALICTTDERLLSLVRDTKSPDAWRVMRPLELVERLHSGKPNS